LSMSRTSVVVRVSLYKYIRSTPLIPDNDLGERCEEGGIRAGRRQGTEGLCVGPLLAGGNATRYVSLSMDRFSFDRQLPLSANLRRLFQHELRDAEGELRGAGGGDRDGRIHEFRRHMKRVRSLLRLTHGMLGEEIYRRENARFRDAARNLAGSRDAAVLVLTLAALANAEPPAVPESPAVVRLRELLQANHRETVEADVVHDATMARVADEMKTALDTLQDWPLDDRPGCIAEGLRRTYARGRRAMRRALTDATSESYHEWRKQVKYLWHQVELFEPGRPDVPAPLSQALHGLSIVLGDDHDLVLLHKALERLSAQVVGLSGPRGLADAITSRQKVLRAQASECGIRIYAESPEAFAGRLIAY